MRAYLPRGRTRCSAPSRAPIYAGCGPCCIYTLIRVADDIRQMKRARTAHGRVTRKRTRRKSAATERKWEKEKKRRKKKRTKQHKYIFPLSTFRVVCIRSRAAPGEFNSIFNLPKPLYANSALPTSSTSRLFLPFSACLPSHPRRYSASLIRSSPWHSFLSIRVRRAKGGTRFRHFLPLLRMLHRASLRVGPE